MPDLHSRIAVEIERRLAVARAAASELGCGCHQNVDQTVWTEHGGAAHVDDTDHAVFDAESWATLGSDLCVAHVALHDPADAERRYLAALRVLTRHRVCENGGLHGHAVVPWCDTCWTAHPCPEVLDVAAGLDITEGNTTDG